jgi:hypothetical protein
MRQNERLEAGRHQKEERSEGKFLISLNLERSEKFSSCAEQKFFVLRPRKKSPNGFSRRLRSQELLVKETRTED